MGNDVFGLIYTGESSMQLRDLTYSRSVAAVPFAGRYRCIDFIMSNLVNTGISNVGIIAQKNYHSLMDHLGSGKEWELHRKRDGLFILPPFVTRDNTGIYRGTIDAYHSVMGYIRRSSQKYIIISGSHTVFNTTFDDMTAQHIRTGADITFMYNEVGIHHPDDQFNELRFNLAEDGRVTGIQLNPNQPATPHSSCDVVMMEKTTFEYLIEDAYSRGDTDFLRDVLLRKVGELKMYGWRYDGYVGCISSLPGYFNHNINVLNSKTVNIGQILEVITSISQQTNLLALNAAIEAARAGEAGRGFAVVADEVRNLAHRTQESAQQVQKMIEELQVGARESVSTMGESQRHSLESVDIANLAGERLNSVTQRIGEIDGMNQSVATATEEQTSVVESINMDITEINTLNQEGVENLQSTLRACADLEQQAARLKQLVGSFRI